MLHADADLHALTRARPVVLIFLPNTNELQRFVVSGAFAELARDHELHYVLPGEDAVKMRAAAPAITVGNSTTLRVPHERFRKWSDVFQAACTHYAYLSPSFAIRANLEVQPGWQRSWDLAPELRQASDREFDAKAATMLDGMRPLPEIAELFDRFKPVFCVVPTSLLDLFSNEVVWACETENVACLLLQSGWDNLSSKGLLYSRTPFLGCWGPQSLAHALVIQRLPKKRLTRLGAPHYEFLKPAPEEDVRRLRAELGVRDGERLVLFGGSFRQFDETGTLERLERAIARGRLGPLKIVYRPHPWRAARQNEDSFFSRQWNHVVFDPDMRDRYLREQAEAGYIKRNVPMFDMAYLSRLLSASDAVISPMSTLLVEALILEKPTMAIAFGDGKHRHDPGVTAQMTHFSELRRSAALVWCDSSDRLVRDCARLLNPGVADTGAESRRALLDRVVTTRPGTYAERLADFCRTTVEPAGRKLRAQRTGAKRGTISHAYGAHLIAREYCGIEDRELGVPGYWMHGWIPAYHNVHPAIIALHKKENQHAAYDFEAQIREEKEDTVQWVSRADQAEFLIGHGYRHVRAIGLPITYLPVPPVRRVPGSLLVLPPHAHKSHGPDDPLADRYAEMIADLRGRFAHIAVGLQEDDMAKRQWVESFRARGIDVFTTTDQADPRTLARLARLLATFEYVTTNGFGSHIALAAYCGARVSVYGPYAAFPMERMKVTHAVKMFPELLEEAYYLCTERPLREHYPFLFVEPDKAMAAQEWGAREVGEPCRASPEELRHLFGWDEPSPPAERRSSVAIPIDVPSTGAAAAVEDAPPRIEPSLPSTRPLVLFGMAHAGFFRNFEGAVAGLLNAGVDVHVHFAKAHETISMADYGPPAGEAIGRLTHSTSDPSSSDSGIRVDRIRVVRDLLLYSRSRYESAVDLRARFMDLQKDAALSTSARRRLARALRWTPDVLKDAADAFLQRRDEGIPPHPTAAHVIETLRPDYVVVTPLVNFASREVDLVKAARRRGIRSLLAVASWDNLTNKGRIKIQPDRIAVWNEAMAREAVELHGVSRDRIWITGATVFDPWFARSPTKGREEFCRALGLNPERPLVVYLCSSYSIAGTGEYRIVKAWRSVLRSRQYPTLNLANVLVRPHPMAMMGWMKTVQADEQGVASWQDAVVWPLVPSHPTTADARAQFFDTLFHADAIVGLNTSAMIEAAILGRPVLTFLGHERTESQTGNLHFRYLDEGGFVSRARDLDEHAEQLAAVIGSSRDVSEACARFVAEFVRPLGRDVEASATLVDLILSDMRISRPARGRRGRRRAAPAGKPLAHASATGADGSSSS